MLSALLSRAKATMVRTYSQDVRFVYTFLLRFSLTGVLPLELSSALLLFGWVAFAGGSTRSSWWQRRRWRNKVGEL
ncbi:hypothetical protein B0O80DRAFT_211462 [Mortierella sp. GBAus27b]|nr:hypothetical protein B0O80DRAFT_211462 [Mortierella sp. GBAus27b]